MALQKPVKGIFFDMGWTIFRPVHKDWFINRKVLEYVDPVKLFSLPKRKREEALGRAMRYLDEHHRLTTEEEELEQFNCFYSIAAENLPELNLSPASIAEMAHCKVYDTENYVFYDGVKSVLEELRQFYRLGIISDTWPSIERILRSGGIADCFDVKTYSYEIGVSKPHPEIYLAALTAMNLPAAQTVFVDDWEPNLDAAAEQGIQPVLIATRPEAPNSGKYPVIRHISELRKLL